MRALVVVLVVGTVVPLAAGVAVAAAPVTVTAAPTTDPPVRLGRYATTVVAAAERNDGIVGLSGGLAPLDSAGALVSLTLDDGPATHAVATPVYPGTLAVTGAGTVNGMAGSTVLAVPRADAQYPGPTPSATTATTGSGSATVTAASAAATADGVAPGSTAAPSPGAAHADGTTSFDEVGQTLVARGDATATGYAVGPLVLGAVTGTASVSYAGGKHRATAQTLVGGATVGGVPVTIDDTGVHATDTTLGVPDVSSVLTAAGITVVVRPPRLVAEDADGSADSGGVEVTVVTPVVDNQPGNTLTTYLGKVGVTVLDGVAEPDFEPDLDPVVHVDAPVPVIVAPPAAASDPGTPGTPGTPAMPGTATTPQVTAAPRPRGLVLAGRRITPVGALAGLGVWQLFTLALVTGTTLVGRRSEPDEHACPCSTA